LYLFFARLIEHNGINDGHSAEVYAGGASVALSLLFGEWVRDVSINDLDPAIACFWRVALTQTEDLVKRIRDISLTMTEWHRQRSILLSIEPEPLDLAMATLFMNRSNRSGIVRAGVIGGELQSGPWKLDARFDKENIIQRIEQVGRYSNRIHLCQLDALEFIQTVVHGLRQNSLVYLDPPYYVKGGSLYHHSYEHNDHVRLAQCIAKIKSPWIVSYDDVLPIRRLYSPFKQIRYAIQYCAQERMMGSELIVYSDNLKMMRRPELGRLINLPTKVA